MIPDRVKAHFQRNKKRYYVVSIVVVAGITFVVTRRIYRPDYVFAKKIVLKDSVLLIQTFERWTGPPSWLIECLETGDKFISQADTSRTMGLDPSSLSRHLNGTKDHVNGYTFRRLAMAVPRNG